ncbi:MAG: glycosyltransferase [Gammaproteobacteria bacterium]|nr:glycosyltransferase [Gammaproteobacteria bacterium]
MKPDILFLNVEFPVPTDNGGKIAVMGFLEALCEVGNLTLLTFGEGDLEKNRRELQCILPAIDSIHIVPHKIHIRRDIRAILCVVRQMFKRHLPYFAAKFVSSQFSETLGMILSEKTYNHIILCHDTRLGAYLPQLRTQAPQACIDSIVIDIETNVLSDFIKQHQLSLLKQLARIERRRCARFEQSVRDNLDHIFCLSVTDMEQISQEGKERSVSYLPTYIKPDPKENTCSSGIATNTLTILMVSDFTWQPNAEAVEWMLTQVAPRLWAMESDARFKLVGKGSSEIASRLGDERVSGLGFVDDLDKLYRETTAVAVPVLSTSGIRIKLLDAMRSALPIVSTDTAARAIGAIDGEHLMASNDPQNFARKIVDIFENPGLAGQLRKSAAAFINEKHSIPTICAEFEKYMSVSEKVS